MVKLMMAAFLANLASALRFEESDHFFDFHP
jgi:hypothetical protein